MAGKAQKVFLSTDLCGQHYICYLVALKNQLKYVSTATPICVKLPIFKTLSLLFLFIIHVLIVSWCFSCTNLSLSQVFEVRRK